MPSNFVKNFCLCVFHLSVSKCSGRSQRYGKQLDIIEAARQVLAEQEQDARARQDAGSEHRMSVYDVRLAEEIYVIPAYAEPHCVIVSGSEELQVMQWG